MSDDHHRLIQRQFGERADNYRTSATHARGASLARLMTLADPRPDWRVLDVATGAGHAAATVAPQVASVVAGDLTLAMLRQAERLRRERGITNLQLVQMSAEALACGDAVFDLVVCRVAAHHFQNPGRFVAECARVLKAGGQLVVVDNIVPDDPTAAAWINDFERRRDPSHVRCLSLAGWRRLLDNSGLHLVHQEVSDKRFDFHTWMRRMNVDPALVEQLGGVLLSAPDPVKSFWEPRLHHGRIELSLKEVILQGRAPA